MYPATMNTPELSGPYKPRFAAEELKGRITAFLKKETPGAGVPFLTDAELVTQTGLSRSTVRRALDGLQREGWIERRIGQGTFIGPRAAALMHAGSPQRADVRLALLIYSIGDLAHDWYTPLILEGVDAAAARLGIGIELLGTRDRDVNAISKRLEQTLPDVLACLSNDPREAFVIRDAQRLGIHCLVSGTPHMRLGLPCVREDNAQAMHLAVRHLAARGHRRIALAIQSHDEPWVFERHDAYVAAMKAVAGICSVHCMPMGSDRVLPSGAEDDLLGFLDAQKPTAIIAGSRLPMVCLDALAVAGRIRVPRDFSVVSFEQDKTHRLWFNGIAPDTVVLPLYDIGQTLAELACQLAAKRAVPPMTILPATMREGESVKALRI